MTDVGTMEPMGIDTDLPKLDLQLLRDLVFWAEGDDRKFKARWNQHEWATQERNGVCQTAYCIAGQAVAQAGIKIEYVLSYEHDGIKHMFAERTENGRWISDEAADILGLTEDEADDLFDGDNEFSDVKRVAEQICERRGLTL